MAGGWVQGGGHSPFSTLFGLGVDNVVEFKVVTADGRLVVANDVVNQDLFFALRGGGGGTWGVVVEATFKVWQMFKHPSRPFCSYHPGSSFSVTCSLQILD
jgi:FAD/FMN-containing dehydrogenase